MVINSDTTAQARSTKKNLWLEAQTDPDVILLSPEELGHRECFKLLDNLTFKTRLCFLGIDELHLIYWWGKSFRPAFQQLGVIRARLPLRRGRSIPILGTSATLREGPPMESIRAVLGLIPGKYHLIRRSNMRHDIQIICREMQSGIGGTSFPELYWVLDSDENTVIFCKTISLGFRLASYLWQRAKSKGFRNLPGRIRHFNALNWISFNDQTLGFLNNNESSSITIATDVLSIGWDSKFSRDAIILGEPKDVDELVQKIGRIGRNRKAVSNPRAFIYYTRTALATAKNISQKLPAAKQSTEEMMDITMAQFLLAPCKPKIINTIYDNPVEDLPCNCSQCIEDPPTKPPEKCHCSGINCAPESITSSHLDSEQAKKTTRKKVPAAERITKQLRAFGSSELQKLRNLIFFEVPAGEHNFLPPDAFLPDDKIKMIIDELYSIKDITDVEALVGGNPLLNNHHERLLQRCHMLREEFKELHAENVAKRKAQRMGIVPARASDSEEQKSDNEHDNESDKDSEAVSLVLESQSDSGELEVQEPATSLKWRINFRYERYHGRHKISLTLFLYRSGTIISVVSSRNPEL